MDEIRPILKVLSMRVPGFKKQAITFQEALDRVEKTKKDWQIMYASDTLTDTICTSASAKST